MANRREAWRICSKIGIAARRRVVGSLAAITQLLAGCGLRRMNPRSFLVASLAMLAACNGTTHEQFEPIRYRLTATVETPAGLRSGSSVIEVTTGMSRMSGRLPVRAFR